MLDLAVFDSRPGLRRAPILEALAQATRAGRSFPPATSPGSASCLTRPTSPPAPPPRGPPGSGRSSRSGGSSKRSPGRTDESTRQAAIEGLGSLGGNASRDALAALATAPNPVEARLEAAAALVAIDPKLAAERAVAALAEAKDVDASDVFEAFVDRKGAPAILASALEGKTLPVEVARVGSRVASLSGRPDSSLIEALNRSGGLSTAPRSWDPAERKAILAEVARRGDPARGEAVFRRAQSQCLKCHAIAGAGGRVGPGPGEHRRQRPGRLPARLAGRAGQGGQGGVSRHGRRHDRRPGPDRPEGPPDRRGTRPPRRRGPRGHHPCRVDRGTEAGRLADARRPGRHDDAGPTWSTSSGSSPSWASSAPTPSRRRPG